MANQKISALTEVTSPADTDVFAIVSGGDTKKVQNINVGVVRKSALGAIIGGDFTGDARGVNAINIQTARVNAADVASGLRSIAIGAGLAGYVGPKASGQDSIAIGTGSFATGSRTNAFGYNAGASGSISTAFGIGTRAATGSVAIGYYTNASGNAVAIGTYGCLASGLYGIAIGQAKALGNLSVAIGQYAVTRITNTVNMGPQIIRKDNAELVARNFQNFSGPEVIFITSERDFETTFDETITLPAGSHFWVNEIGVLCTALDALGTQATIRFGDNIGAANQLAAVQTTDLDAAGNRQIYTPLDKKTWLTQLKAGVTIAATGTTVKGRFYFKGMFVEDE